MFEFVGKTISSIYLLFLVNLKSFFSISSFEKKNKTARIRAKP